MYAISTFMYHREFIFIEQIVEMAFNLLEKLYAFLLNHMSHLRILQPSALSSLFL